MSININSLAAGVGTSVRNEVITPTASVKRRRIAISGVADAAKLAADLVENELVLVASADAVGLLCGYGTVIHRLAISAFKKSNGIEAWIIPQAEVGSASAGEITVTAVSALSGTIPLYINGDYVPVAVVKDADATAIGDAIAAAINADVNLPVTAVNAIGVITITAKSDGLYGDDISITTTLNSSDAMPVGVTLAIVDMAGGAGVPVIQGALDAMGTGDNGNEKNFTSFIHGSGSDATTLDAISDYNGKGNTATGLWGKLIGKPIRSLIGSVGDNYAAELAISDTRLDDRTSGILCIPNSPNHPQEIAALAMGGMEARNIERAEANYIDVLLDGVYAGADRWTDQYDAKDSAVKTGVSPTAIKDGAVVLKNVVTFYRPSSVPEANNGYRSMRNISVLQNIVEAIRTRFEQENWQNISIVKNANKVSTVASKLAVKDVQSVRNELANLAGKFEENAWIFTKDITLEKLAEPTAVTYRTGGTGFDTLMYLVLSGEGGIIDTLTIFDINFGA